MPFSHEETFVTFHRTEDAEMRTASQRARQTFRFFWYHVSLDFNRIIPALELACVKVPFSDDFNDPKSQVEHMWVDQVGFDGIDIRGALVNSSNWLKSVGQGDEVRFPLSQLSDWLCVLNGKVHGAYSVQVLRGRMDDDEREKYDLTSGLDFPPPKVVLVPKRSPNVEEAVTDLIAKQIVNDPNTVARTFDDGRTLLHLAALHGRATAVRFLLEHGACTTTRCDRGWIPLEYAQSLEWNDVIGLLTAAR